MRDYKYLLAFSLPAVGYLSVYAGSFWSWGAVLFSYGFIPLMEMVFPPNPNNLPVEAEPDRSKDRFFDYLLYANVPILYGLLVFFFYTLETGSLSLIEKVGMTFSVGIILGASGINVAHELGHRKERHHQMMARLLLLPSLYMHFTDEHNKGHHKHVSTPLDPSSARKGEPLYAFWVRSVTGVYRHAWSMARETCRKKGHPVFSWKNNMIRFQVYQLLYLIAVGGVFGWGVVPFALGAAIEGFLSLETINYIEHYGLRRKQLPDGGYERVQPHHSWNSDHEIGRIVLYELTRHSDHHYLASRKYQVLRHMDPSPQLPLGYPGSMLMALIPPVWFRVMDRRIPEEQLALQ